MHLCISELLAGCLPPSGLRLVAPNCTSSSFQGLCRVQPQPRKVGEDGWLLTWLLGAKEGKGPGSHLSTVPTLLSHFLLTDPVQMSKAHLAHMAVLTLPPPITFSAA